jgi:hypothetical protein
MLLAFALVLICFTLFDRLLNRARKWTFVSIALPVGIFVLIAYVNSIFALTRVNQITENMVAFRDTVFGIQKIAKSGNIVIGDWDKGILFEHYVYGDSYTGHWINTESLVGQWGELSRSESMSKLHKALQHGHEIWLLNRDPVILAMLEDAQYRVEPFGIAFQATQMNKR